MILRTIPLLMLLCSFPVPAWAQCSQGEPVAEGCEHYPAVGCCQDDVLIWCEGGWTCAQDCAATGQLYCGWDANGDVPMYDCGTGGLSAPAEDGPYIACDADGDQHHYAVDCDDHDADVNPDADEVCDNGVDDDCNGHTDGADPACDTGDDDDATGPGDDDDDTGPADDDDATLYGDPDPGFYCQCTQHAERKGGALALMLGSLVMLGRRLRA